MKIKHKGGGFCTCIDGKDGELFPSLKKLIKRHRGLDGRAIELEPEKQREVMLFYATHAFVIMKWNSQQILL